MGHYLYQRRYNSLKRIYVTRPQWVNPLRPRQNVSHFADDIFKRIFVNENVIISIKFSLKFVPKGPINNILALAQIMAWRRPGDKPLSEPVMVSLLRHICVTRPHWVNCAITQKIRHWKVVQNQVISEPIVPWQCITAFMMFQLSISDGLLIAPCHAIY